MNTKVNNKTVVVRFEGGSRWIDTTIPVLALRNPRIYSRWVKAFTKKNEIDWKEISCSSISQIASDWGKKWHHVHIPLYVLWWGK